TEYEQEVAGDVNQLLVLNTSGKPLYLMPGEVISGGKQDRTIGEEVVIKSSDQPAPIGVFCVEQGRWQGRSVAQLAELISVEGVSISAAAGGTGASVEEVDVTAVAEAANRGQFVASVGQVSKDVRLAVQAKKAQGKVWESVGQLNAVVGNDSASSNLSAVFSKGDIAENLAKYIERLRSVGETNQIVGVAVAVNGKMLSVDVFESTPLFRKLWPKLLKSYALDAVAATGAKDDADPATFCTIDQCLAFVAAARAGKTEADKSADGAVVSRTDSQAAASFAYYDAEVAEETGIAAGVATGGAGFGGGGGFGNVNPAPANGNNAGTTAQPVHSSILAN
ncbi:MAG: hypothetical protein OES79_10960, partial [Planctomycetota bacterium]|nr:hypothetical protein [Planctomycetota bacterium]